MHSNAAKTAIVFPGQGSQAVGMGKDFCENFSESALVFEEASDAIHVDLKKLCFDGPLDELTLTENLQPALFTVEAAMWAAVQAHCGLKPIVTAGHSLGEYTAIHAAGSLTVADGATLCRKRGGAMQRAVPVGKGTMAAILGLDTAQIHELCRFAREAAGTDEVVEPANFNAPGQIVIAGTIAGVGAAANVLKERAELSRGKFMPLQVSAPFHCSLMKPAQNEMAPLLAATRFARASSPVIANVSARATQSEIEFAGQLTDQIVRPVLWEQSMTGLSASGVTQVVEIGPGRVLVGLHRRIDRAMPLKSVSTVELLKEVFKS